MSPRRTNAQIAADEAQAKTTAQTVDDALNEQHDPVKPTEEYQPRKWLGVIVTPVGVDTYDLTYVYSDADGEQTEDEPFEVKVPGGKDSINKRASELLRAKRLRESLNGTGWFVE